MTLPRLSRLELARFFGATTLALVLCMGAWWAAGAWLAQPVALAARMLLHATAGEGWLESSAQVDQHLEFGTRVRVHPTAAQLELASRGGMVFAPGSHAVLTVTVDPSQFTYGPALFAALMLGWWRRPPWRRLAAAAALLLPIQVFIVVMQVLRDVAMPDGLVTTPWFGKLATEAIAYGYQLGALMLPTVAPLLAWWWVVASQGQAPQPRR